MPDAPRHRRFEGYRLDLQTRELRAADGTLVPLTAKAFDTLCCLIENRDRVVGKDELLATVWPGRVVEENNLTQAICALRRALGSAGGEHRFILTVPGRGYRFVAGLEEDVPARTIPRAADAAPARRSLDWLLVALLASVALFAAALWWPLPAHPPAPAAAPAALAVLPFRPLSPDPGDGLLELGLAETLIARLSEAGPLRVSSLLASQRLQGRVADPLHAGRQLGVDYVIEGSTQRQGERMRITARLLAVPDGHTLWAGTFDERRDRVFSLQDAIAAAIGEALALDGVAPAARRRSPCDGEDVEAYRAYLAGRHLLERLSAERMPDALAALQRAIALDPGCARAYAGLAQLHISQALNADADPRVVFPQARAAVARALALDPALAEAYAARGRVEMWYDLDPSRAAASLRQALALDPGAADAHIAYSLALGFLGRRDEATAHVRLASELDPLSPAINTTRAAYLVHADPAAARRRLEDVLALEPGYWGALVERARWALADARPREAVADLRAARERSANNGITTALLAQAHIAAGEHAAARALLAELHGRRPSAYVPATTLAMIHAALGETEQALDELERAYAEHDVRMAYFTESRSFERLRTHPRFLALAARVRGQSVAATATP